MDLGNPGALDVLVARLHHLVRRRQVGPELVSPKTLIRSAMRHLLMNDPAAGRHPLDVSRGDHPLVPQAVPMFDIPLQHIGDRLDPAVGMPGETRQIIVGVLGVKIVEEKKRIEIGDLGITEGAPQVDAGPLQCRHTLPYALDLPGLWHGLPPAPSIEEPRNQIYFLLLHSPATSVNWIS